MESRNIIIWNPVKYIELLKYITDLSDKTKCVRNSL